MNVQVVTDPAGRLLWLSPGTARTGPRDLAYQGAGSWTTTAVKRLPGRDLTPTQKTFNRALARTRAPVERGVARLKAWRIFRHARCSPNRMTSIARAVLTLERHR